MTRTVRVGDVAEQIRGVSYDKEEASDTSAPGYLPILRAGNITDAGLTFSDLVYVPKGRVSDSQRVRAGDVVIAASSGSLDVVGKAAAAKEDFDGGFGAFCKVLRPRATVDAAYFAHFFRTASYRRRVSSLAAGANINNLRSGHLDDFALPLPPLAEQRRIADILDRADAMRAKRREAIALLDELQEATLEHVAAHRSSKYVELDHLLAEVYRYPTYYDIRYESDGIPEIRGELIQSDGTIDSSRGRLRFISPATSSKYPRTVVEPGDLVMSVRGTVGKVGLVPPELGGANMTANLIRLAPDRLRVEPVYVWHSMRGRSFQAKLAASCSSTTIATIKAPELRKLTIRVPSIDVQREFAGRVDAIERLKAAHRASLAGMDALFASLQHRAFRGEL